MLCELKTGAAEHPALLVREIANHATAVLNRRRVRIFHRPITIGLSRLACDAVRLDELAVAAVISMSASIQLPSSDDAAADEDAGVCLFAMGREKSGISCGSSAASFSGVSGTSVAGVPGTSVDGVPGTPWCGVCGALVALVPACPVGGSGTFLWLF